jgi:hypothetical protein
MRALVLATSLSVALACAGCQAREPPIGPEETCTRPGGSRAPRCNEEQCARGCNLALDRLQERQGDVVIGCVAKSTGACDDTTWAGCAVRVGVHEDGGPPAPPPPSEEYE